MQAVTITKMRSANMNDKPTTIGMVELRQLLNYQVDTAWVRNSLLCSKRVMWGGSLSTSNIECNKWQHFALLPENLR